MVSWDERTSASNRGLGHTGDVFESHFESGADAIWLYDPETAAVLDCNQAAVQLLGAKSKEQLLRMRAEDFSPEFQPDGERSANKTAAMLAQLEGQKAHRFDWVLRRVDGTELPVEISWTAMQWDGKSLHVVVASDITERKRAQTALAESEARFSVAFQSSPVFTSILRMSDGKYVLANDALVNWLGYPRQEILGRTSAELGMWENNADRDCALEELRSSGRIRQRECRWRNRHGESFTILLSAEIITLDKTPHVLCLDLDITQRKKAEVEILKSLARERELSQLKSNFVSMVSHEFRTPLGIIQSSAELLREFYARMPELERQEQLESISRNTRRMADMMEGVLVLSRLDAGKLDFQPAPLDLAAFCRRVFDEVLSATNHRCAIELLLHSISGHALADERLLGHIFTNLLSNAVKYSEPGATVQFTMARAGRDAVCTVRDQGIGISEEDQQQLFRAFHRGSNVGTRPGTGLGLLLVKRCAELHGGQVRVSSCLGAGTTVLVRLPLFGALS